MSKFYVQCGPLEVVLSASSADQAAMSALDRTLQTHLWIYDDTGLTDLNRRDHLMLEALFHLEPVIRISEQGFDRSDAKMIGTPETVDRWHRLMTGMNRLFVAAGLPPRAISSLASTSEPAAIRCRLPR
jgi:hypothetical protein